MKYLPFVTAKQIARFETAMSFSSWFAAIMNYSFAALLVLCFFVVLPVGLFNSGLMVSIATYTAWPAFIVFSAAWLLLILSTFLVVLLEPPKE